MAIGRRAPLVLTATTVLLACEGVAATQRERANLSVSSVQYKSLSIKNRNDDQYKIFETARRRGEDIQKESISVTAVAGDAENQASVFMLSSGCTLVTLRASETAISDIGVSLGVFIANRITGNMP